LVGSTPAGFERFFDELTELLRRECDHVAATPPGFSWCKAAS